jgi:phosphatidylcholine synthase
MGHVTSDEPHSRVRTWTAWGVHLLTATGAAAGLMALIAISHDRWQWAFVWMGVTLAIDSVDGTLARLCGVKQVLPQFDGALLDNMVDYFTYVIVPAYFLYEAGIVPARCGLLTAIAITLASGYQFCQSDAKTEDHCFKGFPSYWNVVVFYVFMLAWPKWLNAIIVLALAIAVFVPVKYPYPSRTPMLRTLTLALTAVWGALMALVLFRYPEHSRGLIYASLVYVVYYFAFSLYLTLKSKAALAVASKDA